VVEIEAILILKLVIDPFVQAAGGIKIFASAVIWYRRKAPVIAER